MVAAREPSTIAIANRATVSRIVAAVAAVMRGRCLLLTGWNANVTEGWVPAVATDPDDAESMGVHNVPVRFVRVPSRVGIVLYVFDGSTYHEFA